MPALRASAAGEYTPGVRLKQTILRPVARMVAWQVSGGYFRFLDAVRQTRAVQQALLSELLAAFGGTDFGRDLGLAEVRSLEDFRKRVPLGNYDSHAPYIRRALQGDYSALLPEDQKPIMFSMTSGTTGEPKYIPVTPRSLADIRRGWNSFGYRMLEDHKAAWLRPIVQITSNMCERRSPAGLPCGAVSGLLAATQKRIVQRMYVVPRWVTALTEPTDRYYTILRYGIAKPVAFITTANPSSTIKLIETGQQYSQDLLRDIADGTFRLPVGTLPPNVPPPRFRPDRKLARHLEACLARDGQLLPRHFWNLAMLANWTGGTLRLYLPKLKELFDDLPIRDIGLLASEGRFSIPITDNTPAGPAEIVSNVLEFIPAEQRTKDQPDTLFADELTVGEEYFLVVSNFAGLLRYNLDDRVRVVDHLGDAPVIEFLCRGLHTANITGEKLTEHQVVEAMRRTGRALPRRVERFVLQGRFPQTSLPFYELRLEADDGLDPDRLAETFDEHLQELNIEYRSKRTGGRLGPVRPAAQPPGSLEEAERRRIIERGGRSEQYKHQYLLTDVAS